MYQPYPQGGGTSGPGAPTPTRPRSVQRAVLLMYAGAALEAVGLIVVLFSYHVIENAIRKGTVGTAHPLTVHRIHQLATFLVGLAVVESAVALGLWLLMAWANNNGQNWGRITATVLFALNTIFLLLSFTRPGSVLGIAVMLLVWLIGLGAIILLWRKETTDYIAARRIRP
jgi:NADH:ubiquinone oxidoreductase subunit K